MRSLLGRSSLRCWCGSWGAVASTMRECNLSGRRARMAHWENRPEAKWRDFQFNQPYAKGLAKVREVLATTDFDPATLWQWGTMQAMALIEVLKSCEATFGEAGQKVVYGALEKVGLDVGRQILAGT